MRYQKPPLTYQEQITLLRKRGLLVDDDNAAAHYLQNISYYRLSAYFKPFQSNDCFKTGTSFVMHLKNHQKPSLNTSNSIIHQVKTFPYGWH